MYKEYKKGYEDEYKDHEALRYALYLEFTRFVNCEWDLQIAMYQEIKNNADDRYKWFMFLRFEWFHEYDYKESIAHLLGQIGNSDSVHREPLEKLKQKLNKLDPSSLCKREKSWECTHMTRGKYDAELQIDLLMKFDERICGTLKNMTLSMDGKWVGMDAYC